MSSVRLLSKLTEWFRRGKSRHAKHSEHVGVDVTRREFLKRAVTAGLLAGATAFGFREVFAQVSPPFVKPVRTLSKSFPTITAEAIIRIDKDSGHAIAVDGNTGEPLVEKSDHGIVFQTAIDYVYKEYGGGRIYIAPGKYTITKTISLKNYQSIEIVGSGRNPHYRATATRIVFPVDGSVLFDLTGAQGIAFRHLFLDTGDIPRDSTAIHIERESADSPMPFNILIEDVHFKWFRDGAIKTINVGGGTYTLTLRDVEFNSTGLVLGGIAGLYAEYVRWSGTVPLIKVIDPPNGPITSMSPYNDRIYFIAPQLYPNNVEGVIVNEGSYNTHIFMYAMYIEGTVTKGFAVNKGGGGLNVYITDPQYVFNLKEYLGYRETGAGALGVFVRRMPYRRYNIEISVGVNNTWGTEYVNGPYSRIDPAFVRVTGVDTVNGETITVEIITESGNGETQSITLTFTQDGVHGLTPQELITLYNLYGAIKKLRVRAKSNLSQTNAKVYFSFMEM